MAKGEWVAQSINSKGDDYSRLVYHSDGKSAPQVITKRDGDSFITRPGSFRAINRLDNKVLLPWEFLK